MGRLVYAAITSLDGYSADPSGNFDWAAPDDQVHGFVNDLERAIGTYLYGRGMYEVMRYWATDAALEDQPAVVRDYAEIWRAADKIVFSRTLDALSMDRTQLARDFDPEAVRRLVAEAKTDVSVSGANLAGQAIRAGLVDELHWFVTPVLVGGGTPYLPRDVRLDLELLDLNRFDGGVVHLHYRLWR